MITLQQLIQVAPFPEETKVSLRSEESTMNEAKKLELQELCWSLISQWYQNELRTRQETALIEMTQNKKQYTKEDFKRMGDGLFGDFVKKLAIQSSVEDLSEARQKLSVLLHRENDN